MIFTRKNVHRVCVRGILLWGLLPAPRLLTAAPADIPTPESVLGFQVGADFELATWDESIAYFRRLENATDKMKLVEVGKTSEGRRWYFALISSAENLSRVERYRQIAQRLAHPRGLTEAEARRLAKEGKAFVHIDGGLHATEVACAQHIIQLAYNLLSHSEEPEIKSILENVVLMLWPSVNPDGQNMVVKWYESNLGTPYEVSPLPRLYQKYIGHDNNRDAYMLNMIESRVLARTWRHWEPQIIYVHHQSSPVPTRIWLPPFSEPIAPQVHPLMSRTVNSIGMLIAQALEERGQVGATHMGTGVFDAWYPGYIDYLPMLLNTAAFWTETALYHYATPGYYTLNTFPKNRKALRPESLYASPWKGGWWRLRDAVDYMLTASVAVLDFAAKFKEHLLYNRYQAGRDTIRKYLRQPPYAYIIPQDQRDSLAPVELLRRLAFKGIQVYQLTKPVRVDGLAHPAGNWVIPMNQEFAELARQVLSVQDYPDLREFPEGPPEQPYDVAGWTLPYQMDVRVIEVASPLSEEFRQALRLVQGDAVEWHPEQAGDLQGTADAAPFDSVPGIGFDSDAVAAGVLPMQFETTGEGSTLALLPAQNNAFRALNRAWKSGGRVGYVPGDPAGAGLPAESGAYRIGGLPKAILLGWVKELALKSEWTKGVGEEIKKPRIGLYHPWRASIDEGWTRWLLERYEFAFDTVTNAAFQAGSLRDRFDVIIFADMGSSAIVDGYTKGTVPARFAGGIGSNGVRAVDEFVRGGGTLVCMNRSGNFAVGELHLPLKNVVGGLKHKDFFVSGSLLELIVDPSHPVMAGMPSHAKVFVGSSPVFTTTEGFDGIVLAKYPKQGSPLLSGYLLGEKSLHGYAGAVDVRHGKGHVVLLGFRPQWRGQSFGTFRILFNAALFQGAHAATALSSHDFWAPPKQEEKKL